MPPMRTRPAQCDFSIGFRVNLRGVEALKGQTFKIISTNLPKEKEDELRAAFGAE